MSETYSLDESANNMTFTSFKLKFSPEMAHRLFDEFNEHQVKRCADGNFLVNVQYPLNEWTYHRLLSYGSHMEVLEPKEAQRELKKRAMKIAEKYD